MGGLNVLTAAGEIHTVAHAGTHQWISEELVLGVILPEEELALWGHAGLDLDHLFMVLQTPLYTEDKRHGKCLN